MERVPRHNRKRQDRFVKAQRNKVLDPRPKAGRKEFVTAIAMEGALTYGEANVMLDAILDVLREEIVEGRSVYLARFGRINTMMRRKAVQRGKSKRPSAYITLKMDYRVKTRINEALSENRNNQHGIRIKDVDGYPVVDIDPDMFMRLGIFYGDYRDNISTKTSQVYLRRLRNMMKRRSDRAKEELGIQDDPIEKQRAAVAKDLFYQNLKHKWQGGYKAMYTRFLDGKRPEKIQAIFDRFDARKSS